MSDTTGDTQSYAMRKRRVGVALATELVGASHISDLAADLLVRDAEMGTRHSGFARRAGVDLHEGLANLDESPSSRSASIDRAT